MKDYDDLTPLELSEVIRLILEILNKKRWGKVTDISRTYMLIGQLEREHQVLYPDVPDEEVKKQSLESIKEGAANVLENILKKNRNIKTPRDAQEPHS